MNQECGSQNQENNQDSEKPVIAIIGGGFAGHTIKQKLRDFKNVEVLFYDNKSFFEYTPSNLRVLIYPDLAPYILPPHTGKFQVDHVQKIITDQQKINIQLKNSDQDVVCDYCVIATGSSYIQPIKADCSKVVNRESRIAQFQEYNLKIRNSQTILVVGGGAVGVELIAELAAKFKKQKRLILVSGGNQLLDRLHPRCGQIAVQWLLKHGVEIYLGESITDWGDPKADPIIVKTASGLEFKCDMLFKCIGFNPNSSLYDNTSFSYKKNIKYTENDPIPVNRFLQVQNQFGNSKLFSCGDVEGFIEEKIALSAHLSAELVSKNIKLMLDGKEDQLCVYPEDVLPKKLPQIPAIVCISLGPYNGIMQICGIVFGGVFTAFTKKLIEIIQIGVINERCWAVQLWPLIEKIMLFVACHLKQYPSDQNRENKKS
eukprot:TRINITY_DN19981_c0_g1_i7.p1 TRINITY_DN19981_c0_g1~~TRINITY_DN19981_c0_g1_i7.p1  ORF type:complete len:429 (-),score=55.32 TRINITY_DN19981_c0_g1_i7:156-1442(-)